MSATQGKIWQVKVGDKVIKCQTDATLNATVNTSENDPCKPTGELGDDITWLTYNEDSRGWEISFSGQAFADSITDPLTQADFLELFCSGDIKVEVDFYTNTSVKGFDGTQVITYSGEGLMTSISLNAPTAGVATYDVTIQGNGALTSSRVPYTT